MWITVPDASGIMQSKCVGATGALLRLLAKKYHREDFPVQDALKTALEHLQAVHRKPVRQDWDCVTTFINSALVHVEKTNAVR